MLLRLLVNFDLRRIKGQTSLLRSTRKVNKIVTVISRLILTARAIGVTNFPINMYDMTNTTTTGLVERSTS